jgi:hypothetical protein
MKPSGALPVLVAFPVPPACSAQQPTDRSRQQAGIEKTIELVGAHRLDAGRARNVEAELRRNARAGKYEPYLKLDDVLEHRVQRRDPR